MRRTSALLSLVATAAVAAVMAAPLASASVPSGSPPTGRADAQKPPVFTPGDDDANDPYVGNLGNGGYDVSHYDLTVRYNPANDRLWGTTTITARATQNLSRFDLDLRGLTVRAVIVDGRPVKWDRKADELRVTPKAGLRKGKTFITVVVYDGVPVTLPDGSGFVHTHDGAMIIGEPEVAATWFPVNDHPSDKASYRFDVTVPKGLTVVANGVLLGSKTKRGWTTFSWNAREPMASYLATATLGKFNLKSYTHKGIRYWEAVDPALYEPTATPRTGTQYAISEQANNSYKRLTRTISVPAGGASASFWVTRASEPGWDYFFVEARTAGGSDWTTLPDLNGHSSADSGRSCPNWLQIHPFLSHYQSATTDGCAPTGTTGAWNAASGGSDGYEQWAVDLSRYAGKAVELSLTYVSDDAVQNPGVFIDDVSVSTGEGSTSFEADGNPLDGWAVGGAPASSPGNTNDWLVGGTVDGPSSVGDSVDASFAQNGAVVDFLSSQFGPYPFSASGGIVDNDPDLGFALENQTRPIYSKAFFDGPAGNSGVVAHELAHQWFGDSLSVEKWRHIWLNEGFATYAEWLWSEHEGEGTPQQIFNATYAAIPNNDDFWKVTIGAPGADRMFGGAVYVRGAMTLHQLRLEVGDRDFFAILKGWAKANKNGNVTTSQFISYAEKVSGQQLDGLFKTWLFTPRKPVLGDPGARVPLTASPTGLDWRLQALPGADTAVRLWKASKAAR
ncbi:MAG: M1 family aminopeptidase [Terracoccus sp.]